MVYSTALEVIGGCFIAYYLINLLRRAVTGLRAFVLPSLGIKKNLKSFGSWAVVTGCTDGIGKSFVYELAKEGINIVLMSRTLEKLQNLEAEIKSVYKVKTKVIAMDFSGGAEIYDGLDEKLDGLDIGILINNVGVSHYPEFFTNMKREDCWKMINVNDMSVIMMTHIILPGMVSRGKGVVMNISSRAGVEPLPLLSTYSSSKAFVDFFSEAIATEYAGKGIIVQSVMPLYVATKMSKIKRPSLFVPGPDDYARQALGTIGVEQRTNGCWSHSLQEFVVGLIPRWVREKLAWNILMASRRAVLKKLNQQGKQD
ncbi:very-long-chain 3-oxoacyl-CoA reductase-B-like [Actinia tenebrosa]|uniref:Very-long-chain 3-oxoacyl-CoA reductase-B-like n=1 Tax=Actinia tenebrosa TaxID=6105 RepID=A0A6P8I5V7_ACTTE|nr:very-long-chain 3-oxoacyl-CoA reductase-B-like [Actinia tenebrosa]